MKRGTPRHPKVANLADRLSVELCVAVGILELLWHFTAEYAPAGDIGRHSDQAIVRALHCRKKATVLIEGLVNSSWVDRSDAFRLVTHDWSDHADDATHMKLARAKLFFCDGSAPNYKRLPVSERALADCFYAHGVRTESPQNAHSGSVPAGEGLGGEGFGGSGFGKKTPEVYPAGDVPDFLETGDVNLALIQHPTPVEVWDEVEPLYVAGGVPTSEKHRGLILGYISDVPVQKRPRIPNFVKWAFITGRWPNPAKTKGFLSLMQAGDWDVELTQRVLPDAKMAATPSKAEAAQRAASEAFRKNEARRGSL